MSKEEIRTKIGGHDAKITLGNPVNQKRVDKLNAMRIAMTYIEGQDMEATPEKAIEIANEFLEWLEE